MLDFCSICEKEIIKVPGSVGTGYGVNAAGEKICYACCGLQDRKALENLDFGEAIALYLVKKDGWYTLTNWPGTLSFPVYETQKGKHNVAGSRTDVWFSLGNGHFYHGVQYGSFSQICRVKRIKSDVYYKTHRKNPGTLISLSA